MKKIFIFGVFVLSFISTSFSISHADPNLYFDFNSDGVYDTSWNLNTGETVSVQIYVDDWDTSSFSSEQLFGVKMLLTYDETKIRENRDSAYLMTFARSPPW